MQPASTRILPLLTVIATTCFKYNPDSTILMTGVLVAAGVDVGKYERTVDVNDNVCVVCGTLGFNCTSVVAVCTVGVACG